MVRLLLFSLILLLCSLRGTSQVSVSVDPVSFVLNGNPTQSDISYHIIVTNTSNQSESVFWSKRMSNNPSGWFSWICDKNLCYTPDISSCPASKPNVLGPGESFEAQVHMNPAFTEGSADYELNILDEAGNVLANVSGEIVISNTTAVKDANLSKFTVYPNPTTEFFKVTDIPGLKDIELYNIVGNKVKTFEAAPQKQYYVGDLTDGIYLVRLESASGKVIKTIRLSKR